MEAVTLLVAISLGVAAVSAVTVSAVIFGIPPVILPVPVARVVPAVLGSIVSTSGEVTKEVGSAIAD